VLGFQLNGDRATAAEAIRRGCMVPYRCLGTIREEVRMALNIKDLETEKLAAEVAAMAGESKARAVKVALQERKQRLALRIVRRDRAQELRRFLEQEVWPQVPRGVLGKRVTRREREAILGYGPEGV
jgi:antitoxin VapB